MSHLDTLPGGQSGSLVVGPGLTGVHMNTPPLGQCTPDHAQCCPMSSRGQGSSVADCQDSALEEVSSIVAESLVKGNILLMNIHCDSLLILFWFYLKFRVPDYIL